MTIVKGGPSNGSRTLVRAMTVADLPAVHPLLRQLGYDIDLVEANRRFAAVTASGDHALFVAESTGQVIGLLHIYARPALEKPPEAIIQALVVDAACRGGGVGRALMTAAEHWATERGFRFVALTSRISREDAHAFYAALGYRLVATSHLLRKEVGERQSPPFEGL